jgi:hypothetical protein
LDFYDRHHIRVNWSAVAHPRTNDQVECANGMILQGLLTSFLDTYPGLVECRSAR